MVAAGASRRPCIAVSGGADSMCLALLAQNWGDALALVVDHGVRASSASEAALTASRLSVIGLASRILTLKNLTVGPGLAARARAARYDALFAAVAAAGRVDLLVGHHRRDQAETLMMRRLSGSGPIGLAGMASIVETRTGRVLRPLLDVAPGALRAHLRQAGVEWIEDPSNRDVAQLRPRLRAGLDDAPGDGAQVGTLAADALASGRLRAANDGQIADELARRVAFYPEGYAVMTPGPISVQSLGAVIRALTGADFVPATESLARLASDPRAGVLGGVRFMPAGKLGGGILLVREAASMAPPVPARAGTLWDRRFLLPESFGDGASIGAVGDDAASLRRHTRLPSAVLRTLPALRVKGVLVEVPHIGYPPSCGTARMAVCFAPATPASGAPFGV